MTDPTNPTAADITFRDLAALRAMQAVLANGSTEDIRDDGHLARLSYDMADAMVRERERRSESGGPQMSKFMPDESRGPWLRDGNLVYRLDNAAKNRETMALIAYDDRGRYDELASEALVEQLLALLKGHSSCG